MKNFDKVREAVGNIFGEKGLEIFDKIVAVVTSVGETIKGNAFFMMFPTGAMNDPIFPKLEATTLPIDPSGERATMPPIPDSAFPSMPPIPLKGFVMNPTTFEPMPESPK